VSTRLSLVPLLLAVGCGGGGATAASALPDASVVDARDEVDAVFECPKRSVDQVCSLLKLECPAEEKLALALPASWCSRSGAIGFARCGQYDKIVVPDATYAAETVDDLFYDHATGKLAAVVEEIVFGGPAYFCWGLAEGVAKPDPKSCGPVLAIDCRPGDRDAGPADASGAD